MGEVRAILRNNRILCYDPYISITKVAKALTSPKRLYIIHLLLKKGEMSVAELAMALSLTEPTVFSHTKILLDADIITVIQRKNSLGIGKMNYYRIKEVPVMIQTFADLDLPSSIHNEG
ncbi:ArsR/SmtB family transcription factor [Reticulibacter mediterranei]|uniref:ArsR/SmtB family transcription factor n=1 Tax=Reticulibacter mediterranei TaxID=2778369 RepID=UPI003570CB29